MSKTEQDLVRKAVEYCAVSMLDGLFRESYRKIAEEGDATLTLGECRQRALEMALQHPIIQKVGGAEKVISDFRTYDASVCHFSPLVKTELTTYIESRKQKK
jgi:hypothetical protein